MTATAARLDDDLDLILPDPTEFEVEGIPAVVRRLKSREFLHLMRVLTTGLGSGIRDIDLHLDDEDELKADIVALFMLAVPNAIDDFGLLMLSIVDAKDKKQQGDLQKVMQNPEVEVLLDVLTIVAEQEKDDLAHLLGKARAALAKIQSLYKPQPKPKTGRGARSPARST